VSSPTYEIENRTGAIAPAGLRQPYRNPSYPLRDHFAERAKLVETLRASEERVSAARQKVEAGGSLAGNADAVRLFHQLLGVRDQIAECARRMPLETGGLYDEDAEHLHQATAALERTWQRWEKVAR
jgi:hypothetical protein